MEMLFDDIQDTFEKNELLILICICYMVGFSAQCIISLWLLYAPINVAIEIIGDK